MPKVLHMPRLSKKKETNDLPVPKVRPPVLAEDAEEECAANFAIDKWVKLADAALGNEQLRKKA